MNDTVKQAFEYFVSGKHCSQAVLGAFSEKYRVDKETAFKISNGLNSGVRCAEVCGAVTGAVMVIGLKYGDSDEICNQKTEEFIKCFREKNGDIICRNLLRCNISTLQGKKEADNLNLFSTICSYLVYSSAQTLNDLGY